MSNNIHYRHEYILDKQYFTECFEQSVELDHSWRAYIKAIFLCLFGALLVLATEVNPYAAWFVFALGILEAVSVYYQKSWWIARQMLSKAANNHVTLLIDEQGIHSHTAFQNSDILWSDISQLKETEQGWIILHKAGRNYISNRLLSNEVIDKFKQQAQIASIDGSNR